MTEVIDGEAVLVKEEPRVVEISAGPQGPTPFFLIIELDEKPPEGNLGIDLDTAWTTLHADKLRLPATWWLIHKQTGQPIMGLVVHDGDQPYFTKHHVGNMVSGRELVAYGMGKKCTDGTMVRNWLLPNGIICGGDDVDVIAARMVNR